MRALVLCSILPILAVPAHAAANASSRGDAVTKANGDAEARVAGVTVRGVARHHHRYCAGGGAAVTEEQLRSVPPQPLAGIEIAASPGIEIPGGEPAARARTDASGRFELRLRPGEWCLYLASRKVEPRRADEPLAVPGRVANFVDQGCLEAEKRRCNEVVHVGKEGATVEFGTWDSCPQPFNQPCWVGPLPP